MGFLDDLYAKFGLHKGSWFGLPDFGVTEAFANEVSPGQTDLSEAITQPTYDTSGVTGVGSTGGSTAGGGDAAGSSGGGAGGVGDDRYQELSTIAGKGNLNPKQQEEWDLMNQGDGGGGGGGPSAEDLFAAQVRLAQSAAEEGRRRAGSAFDRARGIYDEGVGLLGQRRGEFKDIYDTGSNEILGRYEGERGNLQAGNQGQETNMRNSLRALGMGGSAFVKGQGRLNQQKIGAAGDLATERSTNDLANLTGYNANQTWATGQETGLNRFLQGAQDARTAAEANVGLAQQGDVNQINQNVSTLMQNMQAHQQALQAAQGNIAGYETNPYAVNISSMLGALNGGAASIGGNQTAGNQASNVTQNGYTLADLLKQQAGGNMYA